MCKYGHNIVITMKVVKLIEEIKDTPKLENLFGGCKKQSDKGFLFERLWDIVIKFGCCSLFPNTTFKHVIGNINTGNPKLLKSLKQYILETKVKSGNSGGCSDITLYNPTEDKYIFISCKYFKGTKAKAVSKYDIQNIISVIDANKEIYKNFEIYVFVNDKKNVLKKVRRANISSTYITKYMTKKHIFDINDLAESYKFLRKELKHHHIAKYDDVFGFGKTNLVMRFHQRLICDKTYQLISEGKKDILLGGKPRCGKTYICGGIIVILKEICETFNTLIITPAPTETAPQFTDDLFRAYKEFDECNIIHLNNSKKVKNIKILLGPKNIIVVSKQLLQKHVKDKKIDLPKINIMFFDENHYGGTTNLSEAIIETYSTPLTIKIYLTATYNKPLKKWDIPEECRLYWDMEDEQLCKKRDIGSLVARHGDEVYDVISRMKDEGSTDDEIFSLYKNYPDLHLMTNMFDSYRYEVIKEEIMASKYGFSFDVLFSFGNKHKRGFRFPTSVKTFLRYISGSHKETDYKSGDKSMFGRIEKMCTVNESRTPFTQLWFLPPMGINETSKCLKKLMLEDKILSTYEIMVVNSNTDIKIVDVKSEIHKTETKAKAEGKAGMILLVGNMLSLGITLNLCDVVILLNNTLSSDRVMQMMYRCMSESMDGLKKYGFVVDLNISRVVNTCITYNIHKKDKEKNVEEQIKYITKGHLINIDVDLFDNKTIDGDRVVAKMLDIWKSDPVNNIKTVLKQLELDIVDLESSDQDNINSYFREKCKGYVGTQICISDNVQPIASGKEKCDKERKKKKEKEDIPIISLTKDVLPFIIPLSCILTITDKNKDFMSMLSAIKEDKELLEIFDDQTMIWWNKKNIIDWIKNIVGKYFDKNSLAFDITINIKLSLQSLIDNPKDLLELINSCLKPKQTEKATFGEVFTPMPLVADMLDKLDEHYMGKHGISIFSNKDLTWFDPANGMGNFSIAVYLRLMDGLTCIKNKKRRKRHILENMLYMSELNKKNYFICRQIFDIGNEYSLQIHNGDTLLLDTKKSWNRKRFDIVIGNPPYNQGGIRSHTGNKLGAKNKTIWPDFVKYGLEHTKKKGYLVYINPLSWLKKSHSTHDML